MPNDLFASLKENYEFQCGYFDNFLLSLQRGTNKVLDLIEFKRVEKKLPLDVDGKEKALRFVVNEAALKAGIVDPKLRDLAKEAFIFMVKSPFYSIEKAMRDVTENARSTLCIDVSIKDALNVCYGTLVQMYIMYTYTGEDTD